MKIRILIIVFCLCNLYAKAQIYFDVNAGVNRGNFLSKENKTIKPDIGYIISGDINFPLTANLLFQTGLQYESIHSKINTVSTTNIDDKSIKETFDAKTFINYINIPVKIFYSLHANNGVFKFGFGPYLGLGLSGRNKSSNITETTVNGTNNTIKDEFRYDEKVKFGSTDTTVKRTGIGIGVNTSFTFGNNLNLGIYSNLGLTNQNNSDNQSTKSFSYGLTIGYAF